MFQRLSSLFFGEVEEVAAELKGENPCVTEADEEGWMLVNLPEGATAESGPLEDLLIEHPSMSVYVSPGNSLSTVANGNLSAGGAEEGAGVGGSASSRVTEQPPSPAAAAAPAAATRAGRGTGALAKVTQVARVQRGKARIDRRHLGRSRLQRLNRAREQGHAHAHARNAFLHQPANRSLRH